MSSPVLQRFWDTLHRLAALTACALMLWPLGKAMLERSASATTRPESKPAPASFTITRSELQVDGSAAYWAAVIVVQARQTGYHPWPRLLATIRDMDGHEVFREKTSNTPDVTEPDGDGVRTWTFRIEHPRTLAAERYHALSTTLIADP